MAAAEEGEEGNNFVEYPVGEAVAVPGTAGGLVKTVLAAGAGWDSPEKGDEVFVHYTGTLASDGSVFDSSVDRGQEFSFSLGLGQVIKGWDAGVATMKRGEKAVLKCAPEYAYGEAGSGAKIPPNSTLNFEVELLRWKSTKDILGDGGIMKTVTKAGSGWATPRDKDEVTVGYTVRVQGSGAVVAASPEGGATFAFHEGHLIPAFKRVLGDMKKGEECSLVVQPAHGFGDSPPEGVAADAVLECTLALHSWVKVEETDGIVKRILRDTDGYERPNDGATCTITYTAKLADGMVFDAREGFAFKVDEDEVIEGLDRGVSGMKKGELAEFTIPAGQAFGAEGKAFETATVPGDAAVTYEVELVDFEKVKESYEMDTAEKLAACAKKKEDGTRFYKAKKWKLAARKYEAGPKILGVGEADWAEEEKREARKLKLACWNNAAACKLKLKEYPAAAALCTKVLEVEGNNVKALFRRGQSYVATQDFIEAEFDLKAAEAEDPDNAEVKREMLRLKKARKAYNQKEKGKYKNMFAKLSKMEAKENGGAANGAEPEPEAAAA